MGRELRIPLLLLMFAAVFWGGGCAKNQANLDGAMFGSTNSRFEWRRPELARHVVSNERHVLVEFGRCEGCERCRVMKPELNYLSELYKESIEIIQVDFEGNTELVNKLWGTDCPTYVLFESGQIEPVYVQSFPVSRDHLEAEVLAVLALASND